MKPNTIPIHAYTLPLTACSRFRKRSCSLIFYQVFSLRLDWALASLLGLAISDLPWWALQLLFVAICHAIESPRQTTEFQQPAFQRR